MTLLNLQQISKKFATKVILDNVDLTIKKGDKIAIIGKNGCGKSTLMKIIQGSLEADFGERLASRDLESAFLEQNPEFEENLSVKKTIENSLRKIKIAKEKLEKINIELAKNQSKDLLKIHGELSNYLDMHDGWNIDTKCQRIIEEFNLEALQEKNVNLLSGGEKRRLAIACSLLQNPDLLLLDEPTNHLDVFMMEFLQDLLKKNNYSVVFISHDRYFIDELAQKCVELENGKLRFFNGGYAKYLEQKNEILANMIKAHESDVKLLKSELEWLNRGVKARLKRNEGRKKRIEELKKSVKTNPSAIRNIKNFLQKESLMSQSPQNQKKCLFEIEDLGLNFLDKTLFSGFSTRILQQDKIAIVGKNGCGKTSLLKILLGNLKHEGRIKRGEFSLGYFSQELDLDDSKNLIETFCPNGGDRVWVGGKNMHVYGYLKQWLFPKEFLEQKIGVLSGGEKTRVKLALIFSKNYDCLVLDEPTNDLDIATINILEEYLIKYKSCVVFVSHDRYFVDKVATKLFSFKNEKIEILNCSYSEVIENTQDEKAIQDIIKTAQKPKQMPLSKREAKLSYKEKNMLKALPKIIEDLEKEIKELEKGLEDPRSCEQGSLSEIYENYQKKVQDLEDFIDELLTLEEKAGNYA